MKASEILEFRGIRGILNWNILGGGKLITNGETAAALNIIPRGRLQPQGHLTYISQGKIYCNWIYACNEVWHCRSSNQ